MMTERTLRVLEFPRIRELDLNPCRVYGSGIAVLDARAVLDTM